MLNIAFSHSYFYRFDEKQWNNKTPFPPLGTIYAASFLREKGHLVSLFDTGLLKNIDSLDYFLKTNKSDVFVLYDDGFNYLTKMCFSHIG